MKLKLSLEKDVHLIAENPDNHKISIDGSPEIGGKNKGMRPMEVFLGSLASCASMDVIHILKKSRNQIEYFEVSVEGERADQIPAVFKKIHLLFKIKSTCPQKTLERAVSLAVEKYCSVRSMLNDDIQITSEIELLP